MSSDELSDAGDSDSNSAGDLMNYQDSAMANLAATGLYSSSVGIAAGMAIASSSKKRKNRNVAFETNPSVRKRQQTRLLRRLKQTIDEYTARVGQQAVILVVTPQKSQNNFKVFGAKPLEDVIRTCKPVIMNELEQSLAQQAPPPPPPDVEKHELPPLVVDGIPTPVEKMTQAQLRAFIPLMLKYSTGKGKPGWGKDETRPPWWPPGLPWANVRSDARSDDEKHKISWTHALRQIVLNCYTFHGRQDLLPADDDDKNKSNSNGNILGGDSNNLSVVQFENQQNNGNNNNNSNNNNSGNNHHHGGNKDNNKPMSLYSHQGVQSIMHPQIVTTIQNPDGSISLANPDGTMSLVQFDPSVSHIITLPDGTQAQAVLLVDAPQEVSTGM